MQRRFIVIKELSHPAVFEFATKRSQRAVSFDSLLCPFPLRKRRERGLGEIAVLLLRSPFPAAWFLSGTAVAGRVYGADGAQA